MAALGAHGEPVVGYVHTSLADQPGFRQAVADGTLVIRRASEVPEFNFGHASYRLYKDGNMLGGAGFGKPFNQELYDRVAATGVQQAFGGVMGQDFYATWPGVPLGAG